HFFAEPMRQRRKLDSTRNPAEQELRNQEVLRANRELAAYFKGQRTEREARAALKIIKAFVRDRERFDAADRPVLPGHTAKPVKESVKGKPGDVRHKRSHRKPNRAIVLRSVKSKAAVPAAEPDVSAGISPNPPSEEPSSE